MKKHEISTAARLAKNFLAKKGFELSHSEALELLSASLGVKNFQTLRPQLSVDSEGVNKEEGILALTQVGLEHEYEMNPSYPRAWIKVDNLDVALIRTDEGLVVDVFNHGSATDTVATTWVLNSEAIAQHLSEIEDAEDISLSPVFDRIVSLCKEVGISVQEDSNQDGRWYYVCSDKKGIYAEGSEISYDSEAQAWISAYEEQYESQLREYRESSKV